MARVIPPAIIRRPNDGPPSPYEVVRVPDGNGGFIERSYLSNRWAVWMMSQKTRR